MDLIAKLKAAQALKAAISAPEPAPQVDTPPAPVAPVAPPAPTSGLKAPARRIVGAPTPAAPSAPALPAAIPTETPTSGGLKLPSALAAIKDRAENRAAGALSYAGVNPAARAAVEAGEVYSATQMLEELSEIDEEIIDEDDSNACAERDLARRDVLAKGAAELQRRFSAELSHLQIAQASDPSIAEIARIVKLTFMRAKSAPAAWAFMDLQDKAAVIQAMRIMADKRQSATKTRKKTDAGEYSKSIETMSAPALSDEVSDLLGQFGFDIGGL
jgi:hypothetical protein